jgi:hypothetical protein
MAEAAAQSWQVSFAVTLDALVEFRCSHGAGAVASG